MNGLLEKWELADGNSIPGLGYGTFKMRPEAAREAVQTAIRAGYRHIDGAWAYYNEEGVGQGIRDSGISRQELFLTGKVPNQFHGYEKAIWSCEDSLRQLKTDYLDLLLIHWPLVIGMEGRYEEDILETWRAFEQLKKEGKVRSIGVSNFEKEHLELLFREASEKPVVDQIQVNPQCRQKELVSFCKDHGVVVEGWAPLARTAAFERDVLKELAGKYKKTPAQLCLRFVIQEGVLPLVKSAGEAHIRENADVFDFEISREDQEKIGSLEQYGRLSQDGYVPRGPQDPMF